MSKTTIQQLSEYGQSIWLDYISRPLLETGKLQDLIQKGLRGMTSNPAIFNQAIGSSSDYDAAIVQLKGSGKSVFEIYDDLSIKDIQDAADKFKAVFEATKGLDGYVSLEINPLLADKIREQAEEGKRLFKKVNRPNVMIKVPSTAQGFSVIEELIAEGINVNVTLIFSLAQYEKTAQAYIAGLEKRVQGGQDISGIHSVASVFISRVDSVVDALLDEKILAATGEDDALASLKGKAAVANARMIFERSKVIFSSQDFQALKAKGANLQRVLWGSTSTKNPDYSDVKYVEELIGRPTVNTLPEKTLMAFLDHGQARPAFDNDAGSYEQALKQLQNKGIDIDAICQKLLDDGCQSFNEAFETLLKSIESKAHQLSAAR